MTAPKIELRGEARVRPEHEALSGETEAQADLITFDHWPPRELPGLSRCAIPEPRHLPAEAVAAVLHLVLAGQATLSLLDDVDFETRYCNEVLFAVDAPDGRWLIQIFNDCAEVDYVDRALAPDGRSGDFDSWCAEPGDLWPLQLLTDEEESRLEEMIFALEPIGRPKCPICGAPGFLGLAGEGLVFSYGDRCPGEDRVDAVVGEPWPNPGRDPLIDEWNRTHGGPTEGEPWRAFVEKWNADYRTEHDAEIAQLETYLAAGGQLVPRERRVVVGRDLAAPEGDHSPAVLAARQADGPGELRFLKNRQAGVAEPKYFRAWDLGAPGGDHSTAVLATQADDGTITVSGSFELHATPEDEARIKESFRAQLASLDQLITAVRRLPNIVDLWAQRQLSDRTARLYRRVYGKLPPGSNRTARLRKKRLRGMPTRDHLVWLLDRQREKRALAGMPAGDREALRRQAHREKVDHDKALWAGRIAETRERITAIKAQAAEGGQALLVLPRREPMPEEGAREYDHRVAKWMFEPAGVPKPERGLPRKD